MMDHSSLNKNSKLLSDKTNTAHKYLLFMFALECTTVSSNVGTAWLMGN